MFIIQAEQRHMQAVRQRDIDRICAAQAETGSQLGGVFAKLLIHRDKCQLWRLEKSLHDLARECRLARAPADRAADFGQEEHWHDDATR